MGDEVYLHADLGGRVEEGIGELLALAECRLYNFESVDI